MSAEDRVRWDEIYRKQNRDPYPAPDPLLLEATPPVYGSKHRYALDLAGGFGQNGLWLAEQGYVVDILDISRVALYRARVEMTIRNLRNANLLQVDLDKLELQEKHYDVICVFRYLRRDTIPQLKSALKVGGRIIYETFNTGYLQLVPQFNTKFLLHAGELSELFEDWEYLVNTEEDHISRMVAIKPETKIIDPASKDADDKFDW